MVRLRDSLLSLATLVALGCGVDTEETVLVSIDTPHRAELVGVHVSGTKLACAGGHGFGLCFPESVDRQWVDLRVEGSRPLKRSVNCDRKTESAELNWGPDEKRIAYRCEEGWRVVHLVGNSFEFGESGFDDSAPDPWAGVGTFAEVADEEWSEILAARLIDGMADDAGAEAALEYIFRHIPDLEESVARRELAKVDDAFATDIYVVFRRRALSDPGHETLVPLLAELDRNAPALLETDLATAISALRKAESPPMQRWLLGEVRRTPAGAAAACEWIEAQKPGSWREVDGGSAFLALAAVAGGEDDCPALAAFIDPPCHEDFVRVDEQGDVVPFSAQDLDETASAFVNESTHGASWTDELVLSEELALLVLRRKSGSAEAGRRLDRLGYQVEAKGRRCNNIDARNAGCALESSALTGRIGPCEVSVDDKAKTIKATDAPDEGGGEEDDPASEKGAELDAEEPRDEE